LADGLPARAKTGRSVRGLARWAEVSKCATAGAAYAARADDNRLLAGTQFEAEFGQSPTAIARGARVEAIGRRNSYAVTIALLREHFDFEVTEVVPADLRHDYQKNRNGMIKRSAETHRLIGSILRGDPDAPNIIDGAVLPVRLGHATAYLEADGIGAKAGPLLPVLEFKAWPVVDGRADDAGKLAEAKRQMGMYRLLTQRVVADLGGDPEVVPPSGLLITPRNVGLTLMGNLVDLSLVTNVAEITLRNLPDPAELAGALPVKPGGHGLLGFGPVADQARHVDDRVDDINLIMDNVGTHFTESCMTSCGLFKLCRERAHSAGDPRVAGTMTVRSLPGIPHLTRAADLFAGAPATSAESSTGAGPQLDLAGRLYRATAIAPAGAFVPVIHAHGAVA